MTIETTLDFIGKDNLVDIIKKRDDGGDLLAELATQVIDDAERDKATMGDWEKLIEQGREVAKQETGTKSFPWDGAANFKTPDLLGAAISFGDRATTELLRSYNILKIKVVGKDAQGLKKKASENVTEYMNWQIHSEMPDWIDIQEQLLYEMPNTGCVFKKVFFDSLEKRPDTELIHYPDFIVNQAKKSMDDRYPFTQPMDFSYGEVREKQRQGIWADEEIYPEGSDDDKGLNGEERVEVALDNPEKFYEQRCWFDLDDDSYAEPYIVLVHVASKKVVRIVARYRSNGVYVKKGDQTGILGELVGATEVVKIKPLNDIVKYGFVKSQDGTFLDLGYYHMLTALCKAQNTTTNQLLNAGTLANTQGGWTAKGFRKKMGNIKFKMGEFAQTDISAADLQNGILMHQFKEPSATLLNLRDKIAVATKELSVNLDLQGVIAPNAPATTTLALIQEAMVPTSAIMQRIIRAESKEFKILFDINSDFIDQEEYQLVLDDPDAKYQDDFDARKMDIMPTASAELSSQAQRLQQAEAMVMQSQVIGMMGGDVRPIFENWFDAIGANEMVNQVWPDPEAMSEQQKVRQQEIQAKQRKEEMLIGIDVDQKERALVLEEKKGLSDRQLNLMKMEELKSETILNLEKAETENSKNQINVYTTQLDGLRFAIDAEKSSIEEERNAKQDQREVEAIQRSATNNPGTI